MKPLGLLLLISLSVGDCVQITKGVFQGQYWNVVQVNEDGTYDLEDQTFVLRNVRASYVRYADRKECND